MGPEVEECPKCSEWSAIYMVSPQFVCWNCGYEFPQPTPPRFVGWKLDDVIERIPEGWRLRIVKHNDYPRVVTRDVRDDRLNIEVRDGVITYQTVG